MTREITALKPNRKNKDRINVYLDGEFAFGLNRIIASQLKIGQLISDEKIIQLQNAETKEKTWQSALRLINFRNRSEYEIRNKLIQRGFRSEIIDQVILELKERSIIDDAQFAQEWVESRAARKPRGRKLFTIELRRKSVGQEEIVQALDGLPDEMTLALNAGRRMAKRYANLDRNLYKKKLYSYLYRRGFTYQIIHDAAEKLWCENHHDSYGKRGDYGK